MKPNLSLYNKQWGERWSVRRQVRHALYSLKHHRPVFEAIRWVTTFLLFFFFMCVSPLKVQLFFKQTSFFYNTPTSSTSFSACLKQNNLKVFFFYEKSTMSLNTNTVRRTLKSKTTQTFSKVVRWFPTSGADDRHTVTEHITKWSI